MQVRHLHQMIGRWLPKRPLGGGSAVGADVLQIASELPETAVLHSVGPCPPLPPWTGA